MGHHGEVFGVTAPEAYVPRMTDQESTREDAPGSFVGEDWEEGMLGVEAFQEPPGNHHDRVCDDHYRVPLIPQEQAYANHESQEEQITATVGGPSSTAPCRREDRVGGCRRGVGSQAPPHGVRSQGTPGGRPSAGEASTTLPPTEDLWSPR